ncbi:hypothetical protein QFZ52_002431 [Arthrobacter woluwensis]|uniref:hypothetical protein n=1 Tax=Arthrobacter woluwensis TaxID=156980 RepID=UPI002786CA0D|nr:hypothetical protein [Arthrobacter woluwensis]MDQ0709779.1 hypothetical protein [Arthrobacter woluwensis]
MTKPKPLPEGLRARPFTVYESRDMGVSPGRLRAKDLETAGRLIRVPSGVLPDLRERSRVLAKATPTAWVSHQTAALLSGLGLPSWLADETQVHLSKPHGLPRVRRDGVVGHRVRVFPGEVEEFDGIPMSTPLRTWLDLAHTLPLPYLIAMGDQLIRIPRERFEGRADPYASPSDVAAIIRNHRKMKGVRKASLALEQMRIGADSLPETFLRLAMVDAGLPEPELQIRVDPADPWSPPADLGYREFRLAIQYEGAHHRSRFQQSRDNRRDEAFVNAGWLYFKVNADDLAEGFVGAIERIRHGLRRAA